MSVQEKIQSIEGITPELIEKISPILQQEKEESYNAGTGRAYEEVEKIGKELFGIEKEQGEMATAFIQRGNELAQKRIKNQLDETYQKVALENEKLKGEIKKGVPDDKFKQDYESLKETHQNILSEYELFKSESENKLNEFKKDSKIKNGLSRLELKSEDSEYLNFKLEKFISSAKERFEIVEKDGEVYFKGGEAEGHKDYTLTQLAELELADLIKKEEKQIKGGDSKIVGDSISSKLSSGISKSEALYLLREEVIQEGTSITDRSYSEKYQEKLKKYENELNKLK